MKQPASAILPKRKKIADTKEMAEGAGFEPAVGFPTFDFESSALNQTQPPFLYSRRPIGNLANRPHYYSRAENLQGKCLPLETCRILGMRPSFHLKMNNPDIEKVTSIPSPRHKSEQPSSSKEDSKNLDELAKSLGKILLEKLGNENDVSVSKTPVEPRKFGGISRSKMDFTASHPRPAQEPISDVRPSRRSNRKDSSSFDFKNLDLNKRVSLRAVIISTSLGVFLSGLLLFSLGYNAGRSADKSEPLTSYPEITHELQISLDEIFSDLQQGFSKEALEKTSRLELKAPHMPSLSALAANAALMMNDLEMAESQTAESLRKGQLVSDALVLQAMISIKRMQSEGYQAMGNPKVRIETLLRNAIAADPSDPIPYFVLAAVKRAAREPKEALALLKSSRLRQVVSADSMVTDASIALLELEITPDEELPVLSDKPSGHSVELICSAYTAMRLGDSEAAISRLERARDALPPKVFAQILKDSAFDIYKKNLKFAEFFKTDT